MKLDEILNIGTEVKLEEVFPDSIQDLYRAGEFLKSRKEKVFFASSSNSKPMTFILNSQGFAEYRRFDSELKICENEKYLIVYN